MYLGIDLGTSGVKLLLVGEDQRAIAQASTPLEVQRPQPLWSEQDPESWWQATCAAIHELRRSHPRELAAVRGIGLSGQMHGATLLDDRDRVLRPAILWNDGRSAEACAELERRVPAITGITGNAVMPGFTAPKLIWLAKHEPETFARVAKVLLPKDYLRLRFSGDHASEMSDAAGTLWLDVAGRSWSEVLLEATGLSIEAMPRLYEGSQATGQLRADLADEWGMRPDAVIAGGAGDNAAGAVGVGVVEPGQALLSLGTSGVYFAASDSFAPNPASGVHAFCHCLPERWHQMSVILSAASCVGWVAHLSGAGDEASLLAEVEESGDGGMGAPLFLPYLSGERTPHNDPHAQGVFFGLTHDTDRADLGRAVLEGVAFAFADGQDALLEAGTLIDSVVVIGGGARSRYWGRILASALGRPLAYTAGGEVGPAFGAARLALLAASGETVERVCTVAPIDTIIEPDPELVERCCERRQRYCELYKALRERFPPTRLMRASQLRRLRMSEPFFPEIETVTYQGPDSKDPLAYRFYDAQRPVLGKSMREQLRFAVCYWHSFCWPGDDVFGAGSFARPWFEGGTPLELAEHKLSVAFELFEKLGAPFFTFHDRDLAPEARSPAETQSNLDQMIESAQAEMARTGVKLLWGTANLFGHPRYAAGAATNPDPEIFAFAAAQVKSALEATHRLGSANYVLWGGREGYDTLLNTDLRREMEQLGRFMHLVVEHKHRIGFPGTILIEPKPMEPTKHQYDFDAAAVYAFLQKFDLAGEIKLNIEVNHATLAGHSFQHELAFAFANDLFGSVDINRGDPQLGWDTDQFPNNLEEATLALYTILRGGGLTTGGFNFDAKLRRQSLDPLDLFHAHIGGIDTLARGLLGAAQIIEEGRLAAFVEQRYAGWDGALGREILAGEHDLRSLSRRVRDGSLDPQPVSGRQEWLENLVNRYL